MTFRLVLDCRCSLGESPVWSGADGTLTFIDIEEAKVHRFQPASGRHDVMALDETPGSIALVAGGGFLAALRTGVSLFDAAGSLVRRLAENLEDNRLNDGRTDPRGRFWVGTYDGAKRGTASLYRLDGSALTRVAEGFNTSNGLAFSPDGRVMYHSDTPRRVIYAHDYDVETGTPSNRREFARWQETVIDRGRPDGAAVDADGCYWVALYEGERVRRYSPAGEVLAEIPVPSRCVTMPAFGGPDLKTLYVTTARGGRPQDELERLPYSGGVFALDVDVPGLPEPLFDPAA